MKKKIIYSLFLSILLFSACSTELDVKGNYKETMVVYGLLDQSQAKQYIKVNKAYLGDGNAFSYAQVKDSTQYAHSLNVTLTTLIPNLTTGGFTNGTVYNLMPDDSVPKDPGTFYAPDQANAIYSNVDAFGNVVPLPLSTNDSYKLTILNSETGTTVTSTTALISDNGNFISPSATTPKFQFYLNNPSGVPFHFTVKWNSGANARLYQPIIRFNYIDSTTALGTAGNIYQHLDWQFPVQTTQGLTGGEVMLEDFIGAEYLQFIGTQLNGQTPPDVRIALNTDIILVAGSDDLNTYMEVNTPSTGIVQDKPVFTNINNGLGIFSSRLNKAPFSRPLSDNTVDSVACGQFTKTLKFLNHVHQLIICQ